MKTAFLFPLLLCLLAAAPAQLYPEVPLQTIAVGKWVRPRASVTGTVALVRKEDDGDMHIRLEDGDHFIVCEEIPELKMKSLPKKGQKVKIRGVVRHDGEHNWWELHPMVGWESAK